MLQIPMEDAHMHRHMKHWLHWALVMLCAPPSIALAQDAVQREAICDEVLTLHNEGRLASTRVQADANFSIANSEVTSLLQSGLGHVSPLAITDVDGDGVFERTALMYGGGTCNSGSAFLLDSALARGRAELGYVGYSPAEVDADDLLRWAGWGANDAVHSILGHAVVVTLYMQSHPTLVSFLSAEGKEPICAYKRVDGETVHVRRARDVELCDTIATNAQPPIKLDAVVEVNPVLREQFGHYHGGQAVMVDLDADGNDERVAVLEYSFSGGCGGEFAWVTVLDADDSLSRAPLNAALNNPDESRRSNRWDGARLFDWNGRVVIAAKHDAVDGVFSIDTNQVRAECEFDRFPHIAIAKRYGTDSDRSDGRHQAISNSKMVAYELE